MSASSTTRPFTRSQEQDKEAMETAEKEKLVDTTTKEPPRKNPSWPSYVPLVRSFQQNSLLAGTEPLVWRALGNVGNLEEYSKQMAIREALEELKLAWIATNTTPFRMVVGKLYDHALATQYENKNLLENQEPDPKQPKIPLPKLEIITKTIPSNTSVQGPLLDSNGMATQSFTQEQRDAVWRDIRAHGAAVIRGAMHPTDLASVVNYQEMDANHSQDPAATKITETQGVGVAGVPPSHYEDLPTPYSDRLVELEKAIIDLLQQSEDLPDAIQPRKHIMLKFGMGGENWAHRDDHHDDLFPIQAELLLTQPGKDFHGGQFYIAQRDDVDEEEDEDDEEYNNKNDDTHHKTGAGDKILRIRRFMVEYENAGDLVIFFGSYNSGWWHGLEKVEQGDNDGTTASGDSDILYPRQAIGMLQPV